MRSLEKIKVLTNKDGAFEVSPERIRGLHGAGNPGSSPPTNLGQGAPLTLLPSQPYPPLIGPKYQPVREAPGILPLG